MSKSTKVVNPAEAPLVSPGHITAILKAAAGLVEGANPSPKRNSKGSEVLYVRNRFDMAGATWRVNTDIIRQGSKFDGMSEGEVERMKAQADLEQATARARAAGLIE